MKSFELVSKERSGELYSRGGICETSDGKFLFLCSDCLVKEIEKLGSPNEIEAKKISEELERTIDVIRDLAPIPERFKAILYCEEADWTYRLRADEILICDRCGKTVI